MSVENVNNSVIHEEIAANWEVVMCLILHRLLPAGISVTFTSDQIKQLGLDFAPSRPCLFAQGTGDGFQIGVIPETEARKIMDAEHTPPAAKIQ